MSHDVRRELLVKIKKARLAGYKPNKDEMGLCADLHKQEFIGRERVLGAGRSPEHEDIIFHRYFLKPKGHRYVGCYGSSVTDILFRGGSSPIGMDRHGRTCNHECGVFLSASKEVANYFASRFSTDSPLVEECLISSHDMMTMDGKGWTSPELGLNSARHRYINSYDAIKVVGMHMGHMDERDNRYMTEEHKEHNVPEIADIYIVFNAWDVYPLGQDAVQYQAKTSPDEGILADADLSSISVPKLGNIGG